MGKKKAAFSTSEKQKKIPKTKNPCEKDAKKQKQTQKSSSERRSTGLCNYTVSVVVEVDVAVTKTIVSEGAAAEVNGDDGPNFGKRVEQVRLGGFRVEVANVQRVTRRRVQQHCTRRCRIR